MLDILLKGGEVVDGTGSPARVADVGIVGDRIVAVGQISDEAARVLDCRGLVVAPGIIDIHTHYDAQIFWDPELTPSSWLGVTTIVSGNCGLSIAPVPADQREKWMGTIARVEAMDTDVLRRGIAWDFETFSEYFASLERLPLAINVGSYVGHSSLRMAVMGADVHREATLGEIGQMRQSLRAALEAGAVGLSTSKAAGHIGHDGKHVPTFYANIDEFYALAEEMGDFGGAVIQAQTGLGLRIPEFRELAGRSGGNVTWGFIHGGTIGAMESFEACLQAQREGLQVVPQVGNLPTVAQFDMDRPYLFKIAPAWAQLTDDTTVAGARDERRRAYSDPEWRELALRQMTENREGRGFEFRWHKMFVVGSPSHPEWIGKSIEDLRTYHGGSGLDTLVDLALEDDLRTRVEMVLYDDEDEDAILLQSNGTILGNSDAGAHVNQMCNAGFGLHLLGHWVRDRKDLSLEFAVWRLTGQPAALAGLCDRGHVQQGYFADICVFDRATVGCSPLERIYDLPGGADRLIRKPQGLAYVLVNGKVIREGDQVTGNRPGMVLR